jgi:hypothetical protein
MKLQIDSNTSLWSIEQALAEWSVVRAADVEVWIARNRKASFFTDSRLVGLLASIARHTRLEIVDWANSELFVDQLAADVVGLSVISYASTLRTASRVDHTASLDRVRTAIERNGGVVQTPEPNRSFTYCAFDKDARRQPLALASVISKSQFRGEFLRRLRSAFSTGEGTADLFRNDYEVALADLVFELWENGVQHGCRNEANEVLPGLRSLHVRRHIATSIEQLLARAEGFDELHAFLRNAGDSRSRRFLEIDIADQGIGITDRFLASRPEYRSARLGALSPCELLNEIMDRALSSKLYQSGAGHGLRKALEAVHELNGFVSLRFGAEWLFSSRQSGQVNAFSRVQAKRPLAHVQGTHFNILIEAQ